MAEIKINEHLVRDFMQEYNLSFEVAKEVLCGDLVSDREDLQIHHLIDLKQNGYSICDALTKDEKEIYVKLIRGETVTILSVL